MARKPRAAKITPENQALVAQDAERELSMFKEWLLGNATYASLGKKYGLHETTVRGISAKNNWRGLRKKFKDRLYLDTLETMKDRIVDLLGVLDSDVNKLATTVKGKKKAMLTKDERSYIIKYLEVLLHESKLADGKPTIISSGEVKATLVLPEGVEDAWVIPPDPMMKVEREKKPEAQAIDDAKFEEIVQDAKDRKP